MTCHNCQHSNSERISRAREEADKEKEEADGEALGERAERSVCNQTATGANWRRRQQLWGSNGGGKDRTALRLSERSRSRRRKQSLQPNYPHRKRKQNRIAKTARRRQGG